MSGQPAKMFARAVMLAFAVLICLALAPVRAGEIEERKVDIVSEGVRMAGTVFQPKAAAGQRFPTIIMSHGWGGTASMLREQASAFAEAGYLALVFDYRGWGQSDGRVIVTKMPAEKSGVRYSTEVQEIREVVDPLDEATDILNALYWATGDSSVDPARIGLWGTSLSGGLAVYVAARDPRVKSLVSQVGYMGQPVSAMTEQLRTKGRDDGSKRARGEIGYPPPGVRQAGNLLISGGPIPLVGGPIQEKFLRYAPIDDVAGIKNCAMLFITAEHEELFDNREHGDLAFKRAPEPKKFAMIPGIKHYGIYNEARVEAAKLAVEWFDAHLK